jgi:hypothetical protein
MRKSIIAALLVVLFVSSANASGKKMKCSTPNEPFLSKGAKKIEGIMKKKYPKSKPDGKWELNKENGSYERKYFEFENGQPISSSLVSVAARKDGVIEEWMEGVDEIYEVGCWSGQK